jgi:DNA-binding NarL/FixJ family response regulator
MDHPSAPGMLTERDREVLRRVVEGKTNAQIAAELYLSLGTIKQEVLRLYRKLGQPNRVRLAVTAVREGWLDDPAPGSAARTVRHPGNR